MDVVEESNHALTIELVINIDYQQMTTAILDYFRPDYKSDDEITSWYEGFEFYKDNLSVFYFNHYDVGDDRHCFEIRDNHVDRRVYFKKQIDKFEQYLNGIKDTYIELSCEREPPGGWVDCVLSKEDGKEIRRSE